jgi:Tol biopolymer transport system component/DNA-binding winged helix-turn-helix (wHTH) protein
MLNQSRSFRFGDLLLDCTQRRLLRANHDIYLPPKTFELLVYLIQHRGRVIPKAELLDAIWPNVNVVENTLAQRIREIREALGDGTNGARFIKTIPRVGYQFAAPLDDDLQIEATSQPFAMPRRMRVPGQYLTLALLAFLMTAGAVLVPALRPASTPARLSNHRLVSDFRQSARFPSLSPDASTMAFVDDVDGQPQVWVRSVTGSQATQLTFVDGNDVGWTRWSPRGDRIYFNYDGGIWSVPVIGGSPRRVVARGKNPSLSANGSALVYEGLGMPDGDLGIWLTSADGANPTRVLNRPYAIAAMPSVAPDGRSIVFFRSSGGPLGDLWIVPSAAGPLRRLTFDDVEADSPTWTPDGETLIFSSKRAGSRTLWSVPAAGGEPTPVTTGAGEDSSPQISLDGRHIIYTNVRNSFSLETLDAATGRRAQLTERRALMSGPRFSPEGDRITFFHETDAGIHVFTLNIAGREIRQLTVKQGERNLLPRWSASGDALFFSQVLPKPSFRRIPVTGGDSTEVGRWQWDAWVELDPTARAIAYQAANATRVRWMGSGLETKLARTISRPRWLPDGQTIVGTEVVRLSNGIAVNVVACQADSGTCRIVTDGHAPVPSTDGRSLYFMRPSKLRTQELWVTDMRGGDGRYLGEIGPFRLPDLFIDVSMHDLVVWCAFHEGKPETWFAEMR